MRRRRLTALIPVVVVACVVAAPGSAAGFGTVQGGGQNREHEHITRAALACVDVVGPDAGCFAPRTLDYLAGHDRGFGAVGAPDSDELSDPAAHCDNADFLAGPYPRSRDQATDGLTACVDRLRDRFGAAVDAAGRLVDDQGDLIPGEVDLSTECNAAERTEKRAKCDNFAKAVDAAVEETSRQWRDLRSELTARYGADRGELMSCALAHDDPVDDCQGTEWGLVVGIVVVVGLAAAVVLLRRRSAG